jgi:hypothetical protein
VLSDRYLGGGNRIREVNAMTTVHRVAIYGNSLSVASIGASLQDRPGLELLALDASLPDAIQRLYLLMPDIVLFDLSLAHAVEDAVSLLTAHPKLVLVGLDLNSHRALLLSGQQSTVLTTDDLIQIIERN